LGKRRLETAVQASGIAVEITWHAFELAPELPREGVPLDEWLGKRFPKEKADALHAHLTELGNADGVEFHFERRTRIANTRLAHRAIRISHALGGTQLQGKVVEACFRANFTDGVDVCDRNALLGALADTGVDIEALRLRLMDRDATDEVIADEKLASEIGVDGVPFFIAEGKLAMSGAQTPDVFAKFLAEAKALT
jgi:predicted DsbA family dithiol-disulfide isomerase